MQETINKLWQKEKKSNREKDFFYKTEKWMSENNKPLFVVLLLMCLLFSLLLFNVRISEGGDDSTYIEAGYKYSKNFLGYHFTFNAPLYPIFLSIPISLFGINLPLLKITSVLFTLLQMVFLFRAFYQRLPSFVLFPSLFMIAVNTQFAYYASQTYNEAFFCFFQALFFYAVFLLTDKVDAYGNNLRENWKYWLFFGAVSFLLSISKNVAVLGIASMMVFFLLRGNYPAIIFTALSYVVFRIPYELFQYFVWGVKSQYQSQSSQLFQKDNYDASKGYEDLNGFIDRFFGNADLYFSKRLPQILHLKPEADMTTNGIITIVVTVLILWGMYRIFVRKNDYMVFTFLYLLPMIFASFILVHKTWDQPRLILVFVPFILLIVLFGIYELLIKRLQPLFCLPIILLMIYSFFPAIKKVKENIPVLGKNLAGDLYYGYTPDWMHYLKMSEWCGKNLPDTAFVACRKASMSFIYSKGKPFFPVITYKNTNADTIMDMLKTNGVTHVLVANLRKFPAKADSLHVINTMQKLLYPVTQKYPQKLKLVHTIGKAEPAWLIEVKY